MKHSSLRAIRKIGVRIVLFAVPLMFISSLAAQSTTKGQCASADGKSETWTLVDSAKSNRLCVDPKADWHAYESVQIDPSTFIPSNSSQPLRPEEIQKLTTYFDTSLKDAYKSHSTGTTSLSIKPTITEAKRATPAVNVIGTLLVPVVFSYGGASIRYDIVDTKTGQTIAILTETRQGRFYDVPEGWSSLGHSRVVLKRSAKQLRKNTDKLRTQFSASNSPTGRNMVLNSPPVLPGR